MKKLMLAFVSALLVGCLPASTVFVVMRDVPNTPAFVVMPTLDTDWSDSGNNFAREIEVQLLSCGVRVIDRPVIKRVEAKQTNQSGEGGINSSASALNASGAAAGYELVEIYTALDKTSADYYVQTVASSQTIRIIKRETKEVLAIFPLYSSGGAGLFLQATGQSAQDSGSILKDTLTNLGISVRPTCGVKS